jgi:hypothetical protein
MNTPDNQGISPKISEEKPDSISRYECSVPRGEFIELVRQLKKPFEAKAYIEGRGIVMIANFWGGNRVNNTVDRVPKIRHDEDLLEIPADTEIRITKETESLLASGRSDPDADLHVEKQPAPDSVPEPESWDPYRYGIYRHDLVTLIQNSRRPFETVALIEDRGLVLITNCPYGASPDKYGRLPDTAFTHGHIPKIKDGNNYREIPESKIVYFDAETFNNITAAAKEFKYAKVRKPGQSIPPPVEYGQRLIREDLNPILRSIKEKP